MVGKLMEGSTMREAGGLPRSATRLICGSDHAFVGFVGRAEGGSTPDERMKGIETFSLSRQAA